MIKNRVVVGLSGGVDSSVAAYLLKEEGYEVIGLFMKNWHDDSVTISKECPWLDDSNDAMLVAQQLNIPFHVIDLSKEYKTRIVDYMIGEYARGRTPNPDIVCNREIKFDLFQFIAKKLGAEYLATGHYARKLETGVEAGKKYHLLAGKDLNKDQSYFLCQLNQDQLASAIFPIGELQKSEVRSLAKKAKLSTANKKDSQGLCFIGKVHLPDFLKQRLSAKKGRVIEIPREAPIYKVEDKKNESHSPYSYTADMGIEIGQHEGAHFYTIGQRRGLDIGGFSKPLFVIATDITNNIIYTGMGDDHPGLFRSSLFVRASDVHWLVNDIGLQNTKSLKLRARFRYRQPLEPCTIYKHEEGLIIQFEQPQRGIATGQFVVWYDGDELIGSGVIDL